MVVRIPTIGCIEGQNRGLRGRLPPVCLDSVTHIAILPKLSLRIMHFVSQRLTLMRKINLENHFTVDRDSAEPVYQQLVEAVLHATKTGLMDRGDRLPSINELSRHYAVSRSTIEKSYNNLRDMGILASQHGKSYYINRLDPAPELKVLVLFDQLNAYNKEIFDALTEDLGYRAEIDFQIYHHSAAHLKYLLRKKLSACSHVVIVPHFLDDNEMGYQCISRIPDEKLIMLNRTAAHVGNFGIVHESLPHHLPQAFSDLLPRLRTYQRINLIAPEYAARAGHFCDVLPRFCEENNLICRVTNQIFAGMAEEGEAFVLLSDECLMQLVREINRRDWMAGRHIGIVSYQENDAKRTMLNGITTISPDYKTMGRAAANMVLTGHMSQFDTPLRKFVRGSL